MTISTARTKRFSGQGRSAAQTIDAISATRIGASGPNRSENRPTPRFSTVSRTPAMSQTAPMPIAPTPRSESRSGPSTPRTPKSSAGKTTNHTESSTRRSRSAAPSIASGCGFVGRLAGRQQRPDGEPERGDRNRPERPAGPDDGRRATEHRPEQRAGDGGRERLADQLPLPPFGCPCDEPRERPRPGERARETLHEPREVELPCARREPEQRGRDGDPGQADEHGRLDPETRGNHAARDRPDERPERVERRQQARAALPQSERVRVVRQERSERREEERVDEHDRARQVENRGDRFGFACHAGG